MPRRSTTEIQKNKERVHPLEIALYHAANDYGIEALAMECNKSATAFSNNLDPNQPERHPTFLQFKQICQITQDPRILDSLMPLFPGAGWFQLVDPEYSDESLIRLFNELLNKVSVASAGLETSLGDDGVIDDAEWDELQFDLSRLLGVVMGVIKFASDRRVAQVRS